ncbi:MAG: PLP-dependent aminotransferase family protein [Actinomycetota bacterium]|nr:PLP-dependent aminotransferase family protein [Actinomycetota bacterium]
MGAWSAEPGSLQQNLVVTLRRLIDEGQLPPLARLPSERTLARSLAVSRATVMAAYDELKAHGYLSSAQGSGTWVEARPRRPAGFRGQQLFPWLHRLHLPHSHAGLGPTDIVDFSAVALPALDLVQEEVTSIRAEEWQALMPVPGYSPLGLPILRAAIAEHLSDRGMDTMPEQIIVTTGAQQAINLVVALWLEPGDTVAIEDPTYPGVLPVVRGQGARILGVEVDKDGLRTEMLEELLARESVDLIFVNPTFHNPTGTVLSVSRRQTLAALVEESRALLVESEVFHDLPLGEAVPPPSVARFAGDASVVTIGSMSGLFWSGLRIGWLRGSEHLIARLGRSKATTDLGTPLIDQLVATRLLAHVDRARTARRQSLGEGLKRVAQLLGTHLPEWSWSQPAGGPSLWLRLHEGDAGEFAQVAARHGVLVLPGPVFSAEERWTDRLRLPFVLPEPALTTGIERLARAWEVYRGRVRHRSTTKKT